MSVRNGHKFWFDICLFGMDICSFGIDICPFRTDINSDLTYNNISALDKTFITDSNVI